LRHFLAVSAGTPANFFGRADQENPSSRRRRGTDDVVAEVREKHRHGAANRDLAEEYGAHPSTISHIVNRRNRFA
jgi:hypothetical protein